MFRQDFTCPVLLVALARHYLYGLSPSEAQLS